MGWFSKDAENVARSYTVCVDGAKVQVEKADEIVFGDRLGEITFKHEGRVVGYFTFHKFFIED
jgi:hypothetical protein